MLCDAAAPTRRTHAQAAAKGAVVENLAGTREEGTQGGSGRANQGAREVENDSETYLDEHVDRGASRDHVKGGSDRA